ncbi:RES family NAD+ phosphorylase [Bradyrhizobium zhanjiangense]|uniref:RES family NAD+ phosphorylase n=1 Tax=Bradyrhizobium zhanjiangense TaxID=1325107 RepID=UPI0013E8B46A|nr:RES family NAD+ phosphorylase [Bradyrhizobium zhanjiangense]
MEFEIVHRIRLLDLTALDNVRVQGSIFDSDYLHRSERAQFLKSLSGRITQPVMPDDEPFEYLATQAIADYLATESSVSIDGIIYPSVQVAGDVLNVVLFHKASRVEEIDIPEGTDVRARTGRNGPEGWEDDYSVIEEVPPRKEGADKNARADGWPDLPSIHLTLWEKAISNPREPSLRIKLDSIKVHRVRRVEFATDKFPVTRHRWEKRDPSF